MNTNNDKGATNVANDAPAALLPCAHCGHANYDMRDALHPTQTLWVDCADGVRRYLSRREADNTETDGVVWSLSCLEIEGGCGVQMLGDSKDAVIAKWNRRASTAPAASESRGSVPEPTLPAVASGEPTVEQWRTLVDELATDLENEIENRRASELPRRIERDLEIVREARRMLARSAAAKGEG